MRFSLHPREPRTLLHSGTWFVMSQIVTGISTTDCPSLYRYHHLTICHRGFIWILRGVWEDNILPCTKPSRALKISGRHFVTTHVTDRWRTAERCVLIRSAISVMNTFLIRRLRKSGLMERRLEKDQPDP
jgi:hypothetical protein